MEEEIDLRPYLEAIIKHWYWIIGGAVLAGLIAFSVSSLLPPSYEATALVAVTIPQELTLASLTEDGLVPSFASENQTLPYLRAFPELATSDQLLADLLQTMDPPLQDVANVEALRGLLEAKAGSDPTLILLTVKHNDPDKAAKIANQWAALYVPWANTVYGVSGEEQVAFLESQLSDTRADLEAAEDVLIAFEATNHAPLLRNNLNALTQQQADLLAEQTGLQLLIANTELFRTQIEALPGNDSISLAHQLTALNLQLRTFDFENSTPVQLQLAAATDLTGANRPAQLAFLDGLVDTLTVRVTQIETDLAEVEPKLLRVQQQLQEAETEHNRLIRDYDEVVETYTALVRKVESERLSAEDTTTGVRLASNSAVPVQSANTGRLAMVIIATCFAGMIAVLIFWTITWWREMYK